MSKYLHLLESRGFLNVGSALVAVAVALYVVCMFIYPWFAGDWRWAYVQGVWHNWQALNVGILAFASSVVALNVARFNAKNQRERNFFASKAFLPEALSELASYFKDSAALLKEGWGVAGQRHAELKAPNLPARYKAVFMDCITHADPEFAKHLSRILVWIQVHDARLRDFVSQLADTSYVTPNKHNLITYFYRLGQLQALIGWLFPFARDESAFVVVPLVWEDFRNAYGNLDVWVDDIKIDENMNLEAFTKRRIEKFGGLDT